MNTGEIKNYRTDLLAAIIGSVLNMIGDFLIGANPAADAPTGVMIIDLYGDCLRNSDLRMISGGMLGVVGMVLIGIGYKAIYNAFIKKQGGIFPFLYKLAVLACVALGGAGVHMACVMVVLLYKWIAPTNSSLVGNGIGTAAISIGHLWMFGGLRATMPRQKKLQDNPEEKQ